MQWLAEHSRCIHRDGVRMKQNQFYILGHDELQVASKSFLGNTRLTEYRHRLHAWADGYRNQHWPSGTPEYLLRGYFRMSYEAQDISRVVGLATDQERHDRMLDVTGGDTVALTEIADTQDLLLRVGQPDMAAIIRLVVYRIRIIERNANIPTRLPVIWAQIGNSIRAEALARAITNAGRRTEALYRLVEANINIDDTSRFWSLVEQVQESARLIPSMDQRRAALIRLADLMAVAGHFAEAEKMIRLVGNRRLRIEALARLAHTAAADGNPVQAVALAQKAESAARRLRDLSERAETLTSLTEMAITAGNLDQARAGSKSPPDCPRSV